MARVATRMAIRAPFRQAAEDYEDAVGDRISHSAIWRLAHETGEQMRQEEAAEVEAAHAPAQPGEGPGQQSVARVQPIEGQGNISSDGAMMLVRDEGWKEAKMAACSRVQVLPPTGTRPGQSPGRRDHDARVVLDQHSYVAGLWDADEFARYQYAEGLRRGLEEVRTLTSVNDGAVWIRRVTQTNYPQAVQIVDWAHASGHLHAIAEAAWGEGSALGEAWVEARLEELWTGRVERVVQAIERIKGRRHGEADESDPANYFASNVDRMRYDDYRQQSYPIGSGTVESGVKGVIQKRMCCSGPGWRRKRADGMLALVGQYHSGRFIHMWRRINQRAA